VNKGPKIAIPIGIGVVVIVIAIVLGSNQKPNVMEVTDSLDRNIIPDTNESPEIQKKLDEIKKTKAENQYFPKEREWLTSGPFQIDRSNGRTKP
jgi:hypothetical protein